MEEEEKHPRYVPTEKRGWVRDTETGAIISVDRRGRSEHMEQASRQAAKTDELNSLKDEVSQLKELVTQLIEDK